LSNLDQPVQGFLSGITSSILLGAVIRSGPTPSRLVAATFRVFNPTYSPSDCGYSLLAFQLTDAWVVNENFSVPAPDYTSAVFTYTILSTDYAAPTTIRHADCFHEE
jgi:hypothetical protein